jgi:D-inositol-3-phosphate glycosyltransferase
MQRLAVLSMHTSPLAQPGTGDGGGMNVYVRELSASLARTGVVCDVYTRAYAPDLPPTVEVEPGFRVHHVPAGPMSFVPKNHLHGLVEEFTERVAMRMEMLADVEGPVDAIHANYWLSGIVGHTLKHRLDLPLVSTFHTLDRVKAEATPEDIDEAEPERRALAEAATIACSDTVLASCQVEADQLVELYGADPARVRIVAPGVDHAFFSPGDQRQARRATQLEGGGPLLLFVGRIQPLKGVDVAIRSLAALQARGLSRARLVIIGGPSGAKGDAEVADLFRLVEALGLGGSTLFVPPQRHELLSSFYRAADLCLVPSMSESFGLVALEAAACGTPVVASAVGGLTTLVDDGETGYLVEPRDIEGFADRVERVWRDPLLAVELRSNAAARAAQYTWASAAQELRMIYSGLTERTLVACG